LWLDFFHQSQHLRFLTSWLSLKAESTGRRRWGVVGRAAIGSSGEGSDVIGGSDVGGTIIRGTGGGDRMSLAESRHSWMTMYSRHQAAASPLSLQ
jgi:hypothetical protein